MAHSIPTYYQLPHRESTSIELIASHRSTVSYATQMLIFFQGFFSQVAMTKPIQPESSTFKWIPQIGGIILRYLKPLSY